MLVHRAAIIAVISYGSLEGHLGEFLQNVIITNVIWKLIHTRSYLTNSKRLPLLKYKQHLPKTISDTFKSATFGLVQDISLGNRQVVDKVFEQNSGQE